MCGIYGFIGFKDDRLLDQMGQALAHRGPDDQGSFCDGRVNLGYRRLAIIDVGGSFQPLWNEKKNICLFFNGEIYNYQELRNDLKKGGHHFQTNGDGETIIHWYEDRGPSGFFDLNGMFGFALYDTTKRKVYLVRDHFGIKPLYYAKVGGKLIFASEIKAVLVALRKLRVPILPNDKAISRYLLKRSHDDSDETFFENIYRVPAAGYVELDISKGELAIRTYWPSNFRPQYRLEGSDPVGNFRQLFLDSVRLRLMSEVPLGTALSGGLDSTAVVAAVAAEVIGPRQKTFSAVFPGEINNEKEFIDEAAGKVGVVNYQVQPKRAGFWRDAEKFIAQQDEPIISSGHYAQWKVMKLAAEHGIRVMLDGQGADEMLAGYIPYYLVYFRELLKSLKFLKLLKEVFLSIDLWWPLIWQKKGIEVKNLFNVEITEREARGETLDERLKRDVFSSSLPALLRYEDHDAMAFSIESRVPFLDYRLWDYVHHLGPEFKIRDGWNKWIMREALRGILPEKIRTRRWKVGFTTPEVVWFRQSQKEIEAIFASDSFNRRSYFKPDKIRQAFMEFLAGKNDDSMVFWRIINLELWLRIFID